MLREESKPAVSTPQALPVPLPVPEEVVGGVPSKAEIEASREARWRQERPEALPVPKRPLRIGVLAGATVAATVLAVAGWWAAGQLGDGGRPGAALVEARVTVMHAVEVGALNARAEAAERTLAGARAEVERLEAALAQALAAPAPPAAPPEEVAQRDVSPKAAADRPRTAARASRARTAPAPRTRTKTRKPLNQTDRRLSSVIDDL
jgi:hypothetical protein